MTTTTAPSTAAGMAPPPRSIQGADALRSALHRLLGSDLVVTTSDGRLVRGQFACLDRGGGILLEDAVERRRVACCVPPSDGDGESRNDGGEDGGAEKKLYKWDTERALSHAMIPGDAVAKVEVGKKEWEARIGRP